MEMADAYDASGKKEKNNEKSVVNTDLLLHPELLSQDFILLTLYEKKIPVEKEKEANRDHLTNLYLQHVIPLPQRDLPSSRWGKRMEKIRALQSPANRSSQQQGSACDNSRKRPLIVFDGSSTKTSIKLKKTEAGSGAVDRLKPPPSGNLTNTIRRLSGPSANCSLDDSHRSSANHLSGKEEAQNNVATIHRSPTGNGKAPSSTLPTGGTTIKLKRVAPKEGESEATGEQKSPEPKKKIQHVTWP
nr:PREDICTED: ashwin [Lepisosteus oculatus]XP_015219884.1 PREDICTED: ashwin [Lepisosteus oculatus]